MRFTPDSPNVGGTPSGVVRTKLLAPVPRSEQVPRPRLIEQLDAGSDRKLTLIGAPVGYGKTTLLTQWLRSQGPNLHFAWVSLDEQDNDPVRLWRHVIEALRQGTPEEALGADVLVGLGVLGANLIETALPMLINELTKLPHRVVLVLDDYHLIRQKACHETVAFFVEHLPETIHLVISTRSKPALGLGHLRARGEMNEIRIEQLAFSEKEAASLLKEESELNISRADLAALLERTEGWPAGIYLATLSMRGKDPHAFVDSLRGSSHYIVDLLAEEVLPTFSEEQRDFLLRTSVLEKMSGSLCDEVVGMEGSGKLLRELGYSNLFVVPIDEEGGWYRYHQLFSDFLLYELKNILPKLEPILHGRASAWFEREGLVEDAVRHAIAAGAYERAGLLIARHWFDYFVIGQTETLERWLEALPEGLVHSTAALALVHAWISALHGRREKTERFLAIAEDSAPRGNLPDGSASVESSAVAIRAIFGYGVQERVEAARRAATLELGRTSPQAALARLGAGANLYLSGDTRQARRSLEEGLALTDASQPMLRMSTLAVLSFVATDEESLQEGESLAREARALEDRFHLSGVPQATLVSIALGRVLARSGSLEEARKELESGISVRRKLPSLSPWPLLSGLLALAQVRLTSGDRVGARAALTEARAILEMHPDAGIFPELLERQERKLRTNKQREGMLSEELTERELDVLRLLNSDLTNSQISQSLYVAPSTARTHIKSIYRKLGVSTREEAVEEARARGLI